MHITQIKFEKKDEEELRTICSDIIARDSSFVWKVYEEGEFAVLEVQSEDKSKAWKRLVWLTNRVDVLKKHRGFKVYWRQDD